MFLSRIPSRCRGLPVWMAASVAGAVLVAAPTAAASTGDDAGPATGSLGSLSVATGSASSGAHESAPYIADVQRVVGTDGTAFRVTLTDAGRTSWGPADEADAWSELVVLAPDVATPGMRQQFTCHWVFARVVEPERQTWSLESWRPPTSDVAMIAAGCNPETGGSSGS